MSKDERIAFGRQGEELIFSIFNAKGVEAILLEVGINQANAYQNMQEGDIYLPKTNEYIDVKYTDFISIESANEFKGQWFLFIPKQDITKSWVASRHTVRDYANRVKESGDLIRIRSGDLGHRFYEPLRNSLPLKEFIRLRM
jgi:hypothetical protein